MAGAGFPTDLLTLHVPPIGITSNPFPENVENKSPSLPGRVAKSIVIVPALRTVLAKKVIASRHDNREKLMA
jgi:hypothetical protein